MVGGKKRALLRVRSEWNPFSDESRIDNNDEKSEDDAPPTCFNQSEKFPFLPF
jgi:hypothetical protein